MSIELWGGLECTVNRVGNSYFDQTKYNGHQERLSDLDLFAELGIKTIRYPVLWERTAPHGEPIWNWSDARLNRLRELGVNVIVGLLHHGSGPRHTSLIDPAFPEKFAAYACSVAERYPGVTNFTPINEPLTTARFSTLYGYWYPHMRDNASFARAIIGQCRATVLAMREIKRVNPGARLVQTEDLGKIFGSATLQYQADFENERRWLTWDLLCGSVDTHHPLYKYLIRAGISPREISWFQDNYYSPDVIGINHYLTSDRYLDDEMDLYPEVTHGGNGIHRYADVEAVRVSIPETLGPDKIIAEVWERYKLPIAVTEVHLGCTAEEQLRWFRDVWHAAQEQKNLGVDVRAVTAWSLLGSFDWNCLLTAPNGFYEPGVFDVRGRAPKATKVANMLRALANGQDAFAKVRGDGWWRKPERISYWPSCTTTNARGSMIEDQSELVTGVPDRSRLMDVLDNSAGFGR